MNADILDKITLEQSLDYYTHTFVCNNCGECNKRYIKKGVRIVEVSTTCSKCGCWIRGNI